MSTPLMRVCGYLEVIAVFAVVGVSVKSCHDGLLRVEVSLALIGREQCGYLSHRCAERTHYHEHPALAETSLPVMARDRWNACKPKKRRKATLRDQKVAN